MTRSYGYDTATGVLSVVRAEWVLDDVDRFASRVDNVAGSTRSYSYGDAGHPFAVTAVSGVGVYAYDQVGAMVSRPGGTLVYDAMHRLVAHAGESYVQSTSNQRLVVTGPAGRVLYLGEVEVTANGPTRTVTRHVTIAGTVVAVTTTTTGSSTAVVWSCAHPQNSVTCHAPTGGATPGVRRYNPYGTARNSVTTPATTRGYLGQPADTTGLAYLDNRYYDPDLGVFTTVDPLVANTGTPYLYANANPTTLTDPTGLEPGCGATARGSSCSKAHAAANAAWSSTATGISVKLNSAVGDENVNADAVNSWLATCIMAFAECSAPGADPSRFLPAGTQADTGHLSNFQVALSILHLYALSNAAHFDPGRDAIVSSIAGYDFSPRFLLGDGVWRVEAMERSRSLDSSLLESLVWISNHSGAVATGAAIGVCLVASLGLCAAASGAALVVRSVETLDAHGWGSASGWKSVGIDALLTAASLGMVAGPASAAEESAIGLLTVTGRTATVADLGWQLAVYRVAGSTADIAGFVGGRVAG